MMDSDPACGECQQWKILIVPGTFRFHLEDVFRHKNGTSRVGLIENLTLL